MPDLVPLPPCAVPLNQYIAGGADITPILKARSVLLPAVSDALIVKLNVVSLMKR